MLNVLLALPISRERLSVPVIAVRFGKIMPAFEPFLKVLHVTLVVNGSKESDQILQTERKV